MSDKTKLAGLFRDTAPVRPGAAAGPAAPEKDEEACAAFGYLRGTRDRALAVEFRYRDGNSDWFAYGHLESWRYNPSVGLLLKYAGDVVTLVLIRGSNLDAPVNGGVVSLTESGLPRHRVTWVREMDEDELRQVGEGGPTIDAIEVAECETVEGQRTWLARVAPAFVR